MSHRLPPNPDPADLDWSRIVIVGCSGSGKTTLARELSGRMGARHIEMDGLHHGPGWTERSPEELVPRLENMVQEAHWVLDGNYTRYQPISWPRATLILWLDFSFPLVFRRVLARSLRRIIGRQELWSGNRETWRKTFFSSESIIWWVITQHGNYHRKYTRRFGDTAFAETYPQLQVFHLKTPAAVDRLLHFCPHDGT